MCRENLPEQHGASGAWAHAIVEHILTVSALTPKQVHTNLLKLESSYSQGGNATNNGGNRRTLLSCTIIVQTVRAMQKC